MTCRHLHGDSNCSSTPGSYAHDQMYSSKSEYDTLKEENQRLKLALEYGKTTTPDSKNYVIDTVQVEGKHLVLRVSYPNCKKCSYEGLKVMVYLNVSPMDAMKWKTIDPHFADPKVKRVFTDAPGPSARFPGSPEGWEDAIAYARSKR